MKTVTSIMLIAVLLTSVIPPLYAEAQTDPSREFRIDGAGATFAFPLIDLWRVKYTEVHPNVSLNYQSIGSGGGVKQHIEKTVAFGATDAPLKDSEVEKAPGTVTIPEMIGAITVSYNLPEVPNSGLKLTEQALCDIFMEKITKWNDPAITSENPNLNLPSETIVVAHRSDGSGTTFGFTSYLTKICPTWDEQVGAGKSVPWPTGVGAAGNEGVAGIITTTENSIGYVELAYAFQNDMTVAALQNGEHSGFVEPSLETTSAASAAAAATLPKATESWRNVNLLASPGKDSYPIASFSYIILHPDLKGSVDDMAEAKALLDLISWMITDGQQYSSELLYVPLATPVTNIGLEGLATITFDGEKVYTGPTNVESEQSNQQEQKIPPWLKNVFKFYAEGQISDDDLINGIQYLINEGIIKLK